MASAIPVPGQPGRLWIPGAGVVDQFYSGGNMKIAEVPDETAAGAAAASDSLGQMVASRFTDPNRFAKFTEQRGALDIKMRAPAAIPSSITRALEAQAQAEAQAEAQALVPQTDDSFDWTSPWVIGGAAVAVAAVGGIWWYRRRQR